MDFPWFACMSQQDKRNFKCSVVYLKNVISKTADVSYKCKDIIFRVDFESAWKTPKNNTCNAANLLKTYHFIFPGSL